LHFLRVSGLRKMATLARICQKSPARTAEIPVFEETIGGDEFDRYCAVGLVVDSTLPNLFPLLNRLNFGKPEVEFADCVPILKTLLTNRATSQRILADSSGVREGSEMSVSIIRSLPLFCARAARCWSQPQHPPESSAIFRGSSLLNPQEGSENHHGKNLRRV
jgi:hypothetical protein